MMSESMLRRRFMTAGAGALPLFFGAAAVSAANPDRWGKETLKVGIVGCGPYSHGRSYGDVLLAIDGRRPYKTHMLVTHVWGDDYRPVFKGEIWTNGSAQRWLDTRSPEFFKSEDPDIIIVKKPEDMIGHVDAVMIMDFDKSAELASPFLQKGMPIFVNRPYAPTMKDGRRILDMAKKSGSAVITGSLVAWLFETRKCKSEIDRDTLFAFTADAISASFSRYISHGLEFIYTIVGPKVRRIRLSGWDGSNGYDPAQLPHVIIELEYEPKGTEPPLRGTLIAREHFRHDWWFRGYHKGGKIVEGTVLSHRGVSPDVFDNHWRVPFLSVMEQVFRTGQSSETHEDILHKLATLLAAHKSAMEDGRWVGLDEVENHRLPSVIIQHWDEVNKM